MEPDAGLVEEEEGSLMKWLISKSMQKASVPRITLFLIIVTVTAV